MISKFIAAAALAGTAALAASPAGALGNVEVGILNCQVAGGQGFIFGSTKTLDCVFKPADRAKGDDYYTGAISKFGVDIGETNSGVLTWAVLSTSFDTYGPGALSGSYTGATAEATVALGVGANVMIGPSARTFTLQPVSAGAQSGLNVAVGIAGLNLVQATK
jgi:hypothetical protein